MFYTFIQRKSGRIYHKDKPKYLIIEALNAEQANNIALVNGVYFDGCDKEIDCPCCGDRWTRVTESDAVHSPTIYGEPAEQYNDGRDGLRVKIVYQNRPAFIK